MKPYPEYKATGLQWLPQIPKHWDWLFLSQISEEQKIKNIAAKEKNVLSLSYGNIIRKKNLNGGLTPQDWATYQIVFPGNIILRLTDLQNDHTSLRTGLVKEQGIITSAYTCVKTSHNSAFLHYLLHAYDIQKVFYGFGGGVRQSIGYEALRNLCFPVPSPDEQAQIVRYLDAITAKINKLISDKKKQIALLQEQKQAIINQAVTQGLDPNVEMKDSGIDWLGEIPEHWKMLYLFQVCHEKCEKNTDNSESLVLSLSYGHIVRKKNSLSGLCPMDFATYQIVNPNDIIMRLTDLQNDHKSFRTGLVNERGIITSAYTCLAPHENAAYLHYILHSFDVNKVFYGLGGGVRQSVGYSEIRSIQLPMPPPKEQALIVKYLDEVTKKFNKLVKENQWQIDLLAEYKNSVVSAVVTGKIDVRGLAVEDVVPENVSIDDEEPGEDVEDEMTEAESEE